MIIWIYLRLFIQEADELLQFQKSILLIQTKSSIKIIYSWVCVILSTYPKKVLYKNHPKEWKNKKKHYFHKIQLFEYRSQKVTSYNHEVIILFFPICEKFHNSEYIQFIEPNIILKTREIINDVDLAKFKTLTSQNVTDLCGSSIWMKWTKQNFHFYRSR